MTAPWLVVAATFLFASMGVCVKLASAHYSAGEIVLYRGAVGAVLIAVLSRARRVSLATPVPAMHLWRSVIGVCSLWLWFYAISGLPIATAMTLNYLSSVWIALFLIGGAVLLGAARVDARFVATVLVGFAGVALVLRPTFEEHQLWHGLSGLLSGLLAAMAYLQVTALGRAGEPELRVVFYFSVGSVASGAAFAAWNGMQGHTPAGVALLLAVGVLATVAQLLLTRAYSIGRMLVNASLQYLGIAFAFVYGVLLFGDRVTWMGALGMVLIVAAGVAASVLRAKSAVPPDAASAEP